jgi:chemotaxis protein histidine kinase CheA
LPTTGVLLANLEPNDKGLVTIDADAFGDATMFQIVVTDPAHTVTQTVARTLQKPEARDLRLPASLAAEKPYAFERTVLIAGPDNPLEMSSVASAKIQIYSEIGELFQLYQTMSGDARFNEFVPLGRWHTLDPSAKRELYGRLASHELHVFLKHKDRAFFDEVVRPYLQNKKEKQLVDHWLLGNDLSAWADFYRFQTLNAFERAILARELPEQRESILRAMREQLDVEPINPDQLRRLIDFGLAGKGLSEEADKAKRLAAEKEVNEAREAAVKAAEAEAMAAQKAEEDAAAAAAAAETASEEATEAAEAEAPKAEAEAETPEAAAEESKAEEQGEEKAE